MYIPIYQDGMGNRGKTYIKECTVIIVCSPRSTFVHSCNWWRRLQRLLKAQNGVPCGYHNTQVCSSTQCYHTRRPSLVIVAAGHLHVGSQYNLQFVVRFQLVIIRFTRGQMVSLNSIRFILYQQKTRMKCENEKRNIDWKGAQNK